MNNNALTLTLDSKNLNFNIDLSLDDLSSAKSLSDKFESELKSNIGKNSFYSAFDTNSDYFNDHSHAMFLDAINSAKDVYKRVQDGTETEYTGYTKDTSIDQIAGGFFLGANTDKDGFEMENVSQEAFDLFGDPDDLIDSIKSSFEMIEDQLLDYNINSDEALKLFFDTDNIDSESLYDSSSSMISEMIEDQMIKADNSSFTDLYSSFGKITMVYVPSSEKLYSEDSQIVIDGSGSEDIVPDEQFEDLLKLVNITPQDFVREVKEEKKINLLDPLNSNRHDEWNALCAKPVKDIGIESKRDSAVSPFTLTEIIDNVGYSTATPCIAVNLTAYDISNMAKNDVDVLISQGAQIGLHDFISGSGHLETSSGPVIVNSNLSNWTQADGKNSFGSYDLNDVYGYSIDAFDAEVSFLEKEEDPQLSFSSPGM